MMKLVTVEAMPGYRLRVSYADGVSGEVDLSHLVGRGVFAAWEDPAAFQRVRVGEFGELAWEDGIDLCPDALYLQVIGAEAKDIFPALKAEGVYA